MTINFEISFQDSFTILLCLQRKFSETHKKKLNSVCTGFVFVLALLAVLAPMGFPSTLFCHVAVKPTICDMLLNHEKLGTDTLLPTPPSESREYSLGSPMHTSFMLRLCVVPCEHPVSTHEFEESSHNSLAAGQQ